jgi:hypothetical protein
MASIEIQEGGSDLLARYACAAFPNVAHETMLLRYLEL